jgi:hypothetical protein
LQKCFFSMEKSFSKAVLAVLFLSMFALVVMTAPVAKAQGITVTLSPPSGPPGTGVVVSATNYPTGDTSFSVTFGSTPEPSIATGSFDTIGTSLFYVPTVDVGKYTVTVTDQKGVSGTATFTVTQPPTIVVTPAPTGTQTGTSSGAPTSSPIGGVPTNFYPYGSGPPSKSSAGFWSPLAIGVVAFVVAVACFTTVVFVRRGRQGPVRLEDDSSYKPRSPVGSTQPTNYKSTAQETSPYGYRPSAQPTSPYSYRSRSSTQQTSLYSSRYSAPPTRYTATPQYNQTATSRLQPPAHTKVCKHCKRDVREDLNICPYCFKKLN